MDKKHIYPVVFALDDNYVPYLAVSIQSLIDNGSKDNFYKIYAFHTGLSEEHINMFSVYNTDNSSVEFVNVKPQMDRIRDEVCIRDNYTETIYFRLFIPELLPEYKRVLYLDSDISLVSDVAELFNIDMGDNVVAAARDEAVAAVDIFSEYTIKYLGIKGTDYFNSGVLLIDNENYNKLGIKERSDKMISKFAFEVAPDQDFLNVLLYGKVQFFDKRWNRMPMPDPNFDDSNLKLIHYNLNFKPWRFSDILYGEYFWKYAEKTPFYDVILHAKDEYDDEAKARDERNLARLMQFCRDYIDSGKRYDEE